MKVEEYLMNVTKLTEELRSDIVVIGGGGSGMTAAVAAAEQGAKNIIVLEKAARTGGNANLATGIFAVESPTQQRLGIKSSRDQVFKDYMASANWSINAKIVRAYINKTAEVVGWLEGKGIKFVVESKGTGSGPGRPPLCHGVSERQGRYAKMKQIRWAESPGMLGSTVMELMLKDCKKYGIKVLTKTKADNITKDSGGRINGVIASTDETEYRIRANSVIIAAGDFGGNKDMMLKYYDLNIKDVYCHQRPGMMGDGIRMAIEVGAAADENPAIHWFGPCHHKWASSVHFVMWRHDMLWVNRNGERFMDESAENSVQALYKQPGRICYSIVDSKTMRDVQAAPPAPNAELNEIHILDTLFEDLSKEAAEEKVTWAANTLDGFSKVFGAKQEVMKATVERYNSFCEAGHDGDFAKDSKYLRPINTPPYYVILGIMGYGYTSGGIIINERMEVLDPEGEIIKGLYATGNNAGDWVTSVYPQGGTSLTFAFCSGYIAGENAARFSMGK
jgi:fumarate reductase flavoprotein subunit